jgi:DNA adenine methylase
MPTDIAAPHPFLKWAGGKRQLISEITSRLPKNIKEYDTYIEPFVGGGALMYHLLHNYNFENVVAIDINAELILCYKTLQTDVQKVIAELKMMRDRYPSFEDHEGRKLFYYAIRRDWNAIVGTDVFSLEKNEQIKRVAKTIFLNRTCFNGLFRVNSKGHFNVPIGSYRNPSILDKENLINVSNSIQKVQFHHAHYSNVLHFLGKKTFIYFDPPYRPLTTSSSFTAYSKSGFNDENQKHLAELCKQLNKNGVQFMLSNSDPKNTNDGDLFFDNLYDSFRIDRIEANRAINSNGNGRGKITEILVQNYNT